MEKNKISFTILKNITKPLTNIKYKLQIENSSIVPEKGPIIICSNHLHKRDQLSVYYSTNRVIHYMAKKEYFEHQPTKTLYKMWGAIPTDRTNGNESMEICQKLLENGEAIGIFPEGTRNSLKKEELEKIYREDKEILDIDFQIFKKIMENKKPKVSQLKYLKKLLGASIISEKSYKKHIYNPDYILKELLELNIITQDEYDDSLLLPLKYGAVKLAQKTGATIVTSAGDGKFDSKVVKFRYGDLIKIDSNTPDIKLQEYNEKLKRSIIKTYKKIK